MENNDTATTLYYVCSLIPPASLFTHLSYKFLGFFLTLYLYLCSTQSLSAYIYNPCFRYRLRNVDINFLLLFYWAIRQRFFFTHFIMILIVFDHANTCASMRSLVEIHNSPQLYLQATKAE